MKNKKVLKANLTSGDVLQHLISLTLPMSFGIFTIIGFNLADTFFVGQLGSTELAAMAFTFPIPMIVGSISFGIGSATSSFTARAIGSGNVERVKDYTTYSLLLAILIVSVVAVIGFLTIEQQFKLMGADDSVMPFIKDYMRIWYLSTPFIVIPMAGNSVIRSLGDTKSPAVVMAVAGLVNIILDPLLIFGFGPIPELRLQGAAIATSISRVLTLVASLYMLHYRYGVLKNPFTDLKKLLKTWKDIINLAVPATLTNIITPISIAVVTKMVSSYGNKVVAGFGVGSRIESFMAILLIGLSASLGPFVGQNYGAKKLGRIGKALNYANSFPIFWAVICFITVFFFSNYISSIFNDDPEIIAASRDYLLIMTIGLIGNGILQNVVSVFNVLGKPKISLVANIFKMFVIYLPYALILKGYYNEYGIYSAGLFAHISTGLLAYFYMRRTCFVKEVNA